ncbi:MAG: aldehyde ferredoxin oxidoreductase family protein [Candidatus Baldrarchaeia archaeon]
MAHYQRGGERMYGFSGGVLFVDLSRNKVVRRELREDIVKRFIGGYGINNFLLLDIFHPNIDSLSPSNPLILGAGPLVGTLAPGASKIVATTKLPMTNSYGSPAGGGSFALYLKMAGYDHLIVVGRAERPVYIAIEDENVEIRSAHDIWGTGIFDTTDELVARHGEGGVIAIGPAGENLVKFSIALVDKAGTLGRGGLGAVMGAKNLKAVFARGSRDVEVADPEAFLELVRGLYERIRRYPMRTVISKYGLLAGLREWAEILQYPVEELREYFDPILYEREVLVRSFACPGCPIGDRFIYRLKENGRELRVWAADFFTVLVTFGIRFGIKSHRDLLKILYLVNQHGIDMLTLSNIMESFKRAYEDGSLSREDLEGLSPEDGGTFVFSLIERVISGEGIGDVIRGGWPAIFEKFGDRIRKYAMVIKGLDVLYDPRRSYLGSMEFEQIVCPRGPTSNSGGSPTYVPGKDAEFFIRHCRRVGVPEDAIKKIVRKGEINIPRLVRYFEEWYCILNSLGVCNRAHINRFYSIDLCVGLFSAATGIDITREAMRLAAERIWNLQRMINALDGFTRRDDAIPEQWFEPLRERGRVFVMRDYYRRREISREDLEKMLDEYYEERGWDRKTGIPTLRKLSELGLKEVIDVANKYGFKIPQS